ncbi:MAG: fibronectin type III domain-containing protein [Acidobacteriota bacterium]
MNKNGVIAVVVVLAAVVLVGLWAVRSGQNRPAGGSFYCSAPPEAPGNPTFTVNGGVVTLNWSAPGGEEVVTTYVIEAGSQSGQNDQGTFVAPGTSTTFQREAPAGSYFVRIFARNACGTSAASPEFIVTVP